jgi:hypothetical protein
MMEKVVLGLVLLAAVVRASDYGNYVRGASKEREDESKEEDAYKAYIYQGKYTGKCGKDGLYFMDEKSFVFCSNGHSYVQPCAEGSKNSAYQTYNYGGKYDYRDFCDVNLVDEGYAARKALYGLPTPLMRPHPHHAYPPQRDVVYGRANYGAPDVTYERRPTYRGPYDHYLG